jgi:hypothetical protein
MEHPLDIYGEGHPHRQAAGKGIEWLTIRRRQSQRGRSRW